jgi:hypothetical protein
LAAFNAYLHSDGLRTGHITDARHFSRRRILDFATLLCWFLSVPRAAVQTELDRFFAVLSNQAELVRRVSAQALSKARQHLPLAVFTDLSAHLLHLVSLHIGVPRWHGLRVVAADASDVRLLSRDATRRVIHWAKVFALYLPGVEMVAVGTEITPRPPPRSVCAALPHTSPASGHDVKRASKRWFR